MNKILIGSFLMLMLITILFHFGNAEAIGFLKKSDKPYVCEHYYTPEYCQKQAAKMATVEAAKASSPIVNTSQPTIDSKNSDIPQIETTKDNTLEDGIVIFLSLFGILILALLIIKYKSKIISKITPIKEVKKSIFISSL